VTVYIPGVVTLLIETTPVVELTEIFPVNAGLLATTGITKTVNVTVPLAIDGGASGVTVALLLG
jgi:hypothetical protein